MKKLRPFYSTDKLTELYGGVYDSSRWPEHVVRVERTRDIIDRLRSHVDVKTVADYSCGDGAITERLKPYATLECTDVGRGDPPIEEMVKTMPFVDLFICTETIEHLEAPWTMLEYVALRTRWLVLSTPLDEDPQVGNYEHYWSFTEWDLATMLDQSGFDECQLTVLESADWTYRYQVWTARSRYRA